MLQHVAYALHNFLYFQSIKDMLTRCFNQFNYTDSDVLRQCSRGEWAPFLHNLCYLHGAVRLRARFGRAGWNKPDDFFNIRFTELFVSTIL